MRKLFWLAALLSLVVVADRQPQADAAVRGRARSVARGHVGGAHHIHHGFHRAGAVFGFGGFGFPYGHRFPHGVNLSYPGVGLGYGAGLGACQPPALTYGGCYGASCYGCVGTPMTYSAPPPCPSMQPYSQPYSAPYMPQADEQPYEAPAPSCGPAAARYGAATGCNGFASPYAARTGVVRGRICR